MPATSVPIPPAQPTSCLPARSPHADACAGCVPTGLARGAPPVWLEAGGFRQRGYDVWGGSVARDAAGRHHLFVSRWPSELGDHAWVTSSEIVRATSPSAEGPYRFEGVVLPRRGPSHWDGMMTHNPSVRYDGSRKEWVLWYIGSTYNFSAPASPFASSTDEYKLAWGGKRVGVATAPSLEGPWTRSAAPILAPRDGHWDGTIVSNPAPLVAPDGSVTLVYKSRAAPGRSRAHVTRLAPKPFHLGVATAPEPRGPYARLLRGPIRAAQGGALGSLALRAEDPFLWRCGETYHLLAKTMMPLPQLGIRSAQIVHLSAHASDLRRWGTPALAFNRTALARRADHAGDEEAVTFRRLERPQLLFDHAGRGPTHAFFGAKLAPPSSLDGGEAAASLMDESRARNVVLLLGGRGGEGAGGEGRAERE